jgi:flagellar basal-body rod protein FlgF
VSAQGYPVVDSGGRPIQVPTGAGEITITRDGTISTPQGAVGKLDVVQFAKEDQLRPAANGLYVTDAKPTPAAPATQVMQGMVEESNVKPIVEITRMMTLSRAFEFSKGMLDGESDRVKSAIEKLGKVA